jgi:uncharacterized protein YdcH (DUF465 family)
VTAEQRQEGDIMNMPRKRWFAAAALAIAVAGWWLLRPDPNLRRVQALRLELMSAEAKNLSKEARSEKWKELGATMKSLSPAQRQVLAQEGQKRYQAELERYAKLSPAEQKRHLDEQINRMESARKKMSQMKGKAPAGIAKKNTRPRSQEERERMRKQRLDQTTPELRALMDRYRRDMAARRQQLGLPAFGFGAHGGRFVPA